MNETNNTENINKTNYATNDQTTYERSDKPVTGSETAQTDGTAENTMSGDKAGSMQDAGNNEFTAYDQSSAASNDSKEPQSSEASGYSPNFIMRETSSPESNAREDIQKIREARAKARRQAGAEQTGSGSYAENNRSGYGQQYSTNQYGTDAAGSQRYGTDQSYSQSGYARASQQNAKQQHFSSDADHTYSQAGYGRNQQAGQDSSSYSQNAYARPSASGEDSIYSRSDHGGTSQQDINSRPYAAGSNQQNYSESSGQRSYSQPGSGYGNASQANSYSGGNPNYTDYSNYGNSQFGSESDNYNDDPRSKFKNGDSASWTNGEIKINKAKKKKKEKKPSKPVTLTRKTVSLLVAACLVISCLCGFGGVFAANSLLNNNSNTASSSGSGSAKTTGYTLEDATGSNMTVKEITAAVQSSVVEIKTESVSSDSWMQQYVTEGAGSGVIISEDGYIMTNNHVIEGAKTITVTTADEKEYEAELVGTDTIDDVAVIKIDATGLKAVTYGNSDELEVGDLAVAIGNPLGELGGTVTAGIISATDRELSIDGKTMTLLQTDSSINPGNSGGGLFNSSGQLIGLVVAKSSGSDVEGLGFAIPINTAADKAQQIMDNGYVSDQPWTGMSYTEGSTGGSYSFFGESEASTNVYIASVDTATAKRAGFEAGDMVFAVDGTQISSIEDLSSIVTSHKVGDKLKFTIVRDGQTKDITIKLQEKTAAEN